MSAFEYISEYYGVPAKRGQRVTWRGEPGKITSTEGPHIVVRLDGKKLRRVILHPKDDDLVYVEAKEES